MNVFEVHLRLARASNLPTVWSNVLCAAILVGVTDPQTLTLLFIASSMLYTGGMYLNDWCDAAFDSKHRPERPIPSNQISRNAVLACSVGWLGGGFLLGLLLNPQAIIWAAALVVFIVWYDINHKQNRMSPLIMAACRASLYPWTATICIGHTPAIVWLSAGAIFCYVVGLSYVARGIKSSKALLIASLIALSVPVILYLPAPFIQTDTWIWLTMAIFILWTIYSLLGLWRKPPNIDFTISGLLAGIIWVDLHSVATMGSFDLVIGFIFLAFFIMTILMQRRIPAT
ncbi:UbiA family prenyltransferase [Rubellicoccus peritrichatus]|uniref:UbiA family prenyltransferase n=1 Tax=Rubellicoccus peritrichatus TaxID=3080537 RepID=A0AAQ3QW38_9BACT|nr:UbiA family prenyltransferase [Puniceicoccus sp. CR14]WOO41492.1 UbiA family prenyltransferase [Puniceicoccus sp. CR14]